MEDIKEKIEAKLLKQQENKEFKDVGRVSQTRKEKSAYKLISGSILSTIEEDSVMAYNMVKKENVWPEINVSNEKESGVTAGAAYLKVKIRESAPTRPKDDKQKRATYVLFLELLQADLAQCFTVKQIRQLDDKYRSLKMNEVIGYFIDPTFFSATEERKVEIEDKLKMNLSFRANSLYGSTTLVPKLINEVFGARFANTLLNKSDASKVLFYEAELKEPITEEESATLITALLDRKEKFIAANEKLKTEEKLKTKEQLLYSLERDWSIGSDSKKIYKQDIEKFREWVISYYDRRIRNESARWTEKEKELQPRGNDWSWTEKSTEKKEIVTKSEAINTKTPLSFIKRTGGYKVTENSPTEIVEKFGFSAVNYGVYVDDIWSKEHTKHFLEAMTDLGEMINLNIKQINELGKLSIAFGAKGRKGHAATYFPQTKDINLTRGNGDGSVAHEYGHYFDNVIVELDEKLATNKFASQGQMQDITIRSLYKELMDFYYKGNDLYTPKVPMEFYAKKATQPPTYSNSGKWAAVEIKPTIEETLEQLSGYAVVNKDLHSTQVRLFGYVISAFDLESYNVPMKLRTSYVYHKSAYNSFKYCYQTGTAKGTIIGANPRTNYWTSAVELFARAWETVILKKLTDMGRVSNYLVNDIPMVDIVSENYNRPYPAGKELEYIEKLIDKIVLAVKNRFSISDFVPPSIIKEDEYLELDKKGDVKEGVVIEEVEGEPEKVVEFIEPEKEWSEAISTLSMLIDLGGTEEELKEWQEAVETMKLIM